MADEKSDEELKKLRERLAAFHDDIKERQDAERKVIKDRRDDAVRIALGLRENTPPDQVRQHVLAVQGNRFAPEALRRIESDMASRERETRRNTLSMILSEEKQELQKVSKKYEMERDDARKQQRDEENRMTARQEYERQQRAQATPAHDHDRQLKNSNERFDALRDDLKRQYYDDRREIKRERYDAIVVALSLPEGIPPYALHQHVRAAQGLQHADIDARRWEYKANANDREIRHNTVNNILQQEKQQLTERRGQYLRDRETIQQQQKDSEKFLVERRERERQRAEAAEGARKEREERERGRTRDESRSR